MDFLKKLPTPEELAKIYPNVDARYDELLFTGLRERIEKSPKNKVLIVLHTTTSHGPQYASKYPKEQHKTIYHGKSYHQSYFHVLQLKSKIES